MELENCGLAASAFRRDIYLLAAISVGGQVFLAWSLGRHTALATPKLWDLLGHTCVCVCVCVSMCACRCGHSRVNFVNCGVGG